MKQCLGCPVLPDKRPTEGRGQPFGCEYFALQMDDDEGLSAWAMSKSMGILENGVGLKVFAHPSSANHSYCIRKKEQTPS